MKADEKGWNGSFSIINLILCGTREREIQNEVVYEKQKGCDDVDDKNFHFDVRKLLLGREKCILFFRCVCRREWRQRQRIKHDCLLFLTGTSVFSAEINPTTIDGDKISSPFLNDTPSKSHTTHIFFGPEKITAPTRVESTQKRAERKGNLDSLSHS